MEMPIAIQMEPDGAAHGGLRAPLLDLRDAEMPVSTTAAIMVTGQARALRPQVDQAMAT